MRTGVQPGVRAGGPGASGAVQKRPGASRGGPGVPQERLEDGPGFIGLPLGRPGVPRWAP